MPRRKTLTLVKLANKVQTVRDQVKFLQTHHLLPREQKCPKCDKLMKTLGKTILDILKVILT